MKNHQKPSKFIKINDFQSQICSKSRFFSGIQSFCLINVRQRKLMVSLFAMSTSTFGQSPKKNPAPDGLVRAAAVNKEEKQASRKTRPEDREAALREADRIIEKLEQSYLRTATALRSLNNLGS